MPVLSYAEGTVIIRGEADCSDGHLSDRCGWGTPGSKLPGDSSDSDGRDNGGGGGGDTLDQAALGISQMLKDVRCAPNMGSYNKTTSKSSETDKFEAANRVQANLNAKASLFNRLIGAIFVLRGSKIYVEVTYADNGSELWLVTGSLGTLAVIESLPCTLTPGTGVVEPSQNCPKIG